MGNSLSDSVDLPCSSHFSATSDLVVAYNPVFWEQLIRGDWVTAEKPTSVLILLLPSNLLNNW